MDVLVNDLYADGKILDLVVPEPSSYLKWALERLITEEHRTLVLENLKACHSLVQSIVKHGWAHDARPTLLGVLEAKPDSVFRCCCRSP